MGAGSPIVERYREGVRSIEERFFAQVGGSAFAALVVEPLGINDPAVVTAMRAARPDCLLVFGTSLLGPELLAIPRLGAMNIHTGITQLLRGVDSAFWAIHDGCPEGIGATIHLIDRTVDAGQVLAQGRPSLDEDDPLGVLFVKSVALGFELMRASIHRIRGSGLRPSPLPRRGRLRRLSDLTEDSVRRAEERRRSVLRGYLLNKHARDAKSPILHLDRELPN